LICQSKHNSLMAAEIHDQLRRLIIKRHLNEISNAEILRDLEIHPSIVCRIIEKYINRLDFSTRTRGGDRKTVLTNEHREFLKNILKEGCQKTLKFLQEKVNEEFDLTVSIKLIDRAIDSFNFSLKRISLIPVRQNTKENIDLRHQYS
ncbi:putative transposon, partial [Pseudoloma neurophilia]